jgi:hypothetical protein
VKKKDVEQEGDKMAFYDTLGNPLKLGDMVAVASRDKRIGLVIGSIIRMEKSITVKPIDEESRAYVVPARQDKARDILLINDLFAP